MCLSGQALIMEGEKPQSEAQVNEWVTAEMHSFWYIKLEIFVFYLPISKQIIYNWPENDHFLPLNRKQVEGQ